MCPWRNGASAGGLGPWPRPEPLRMSREDYRRWAEAQPRGGFERAAGEVVAMAPERVAHNRVKARMWRALDGAIRTAGLPCEALTDGITVEVGDDHDYESDAVVNCGDPLPDDAVAAPNPVTVVEVLSPSTRSTPARGWRTTSVCPRSSIT